MFDECTVSEIQNKPIQTENSQVLQKNYVIPYVNEAIFDELVSRHLER